MGLHSMVDQDSTLKHLQGFIECDLPNPELYEYRGQMNVTNSKCKFGGSLTLTESQLLPKGVKLMNTDWIVGIVAYTGLDTKLMMN